MLIESEISSLQSKHAKIVESLLGNGYELSEICLRESNPKYRFGTGPRADLYLDVNGEIET